MNAILYIIAVILIIGWILGVFVYAVGSLIHILLVIAVVAIILGMIRGFGRLMISIIKQHFLWNIQKPGTKSTRNLLNFRRALSRFGGNRHGSMAVHHYSNYHCGGLDDLNVIGFIYHWDVYPYILLNLVFSTQAAYAAPIIMMAQNRQSERDRHHAEQDLKTNVEAKKEIEQRLKKLLILSR